MSDKKVDLTTLEQGDTVVFRNEKKAFIGLVAECKYEGIGAGFRLDFFAENYKGAVVYFHDNYFKNGCTMFVDNVDYDIIQIIKNPKRWTDDDMRAACQLGIETQFNDARCLNGSVINFRKWLEHYKVAKK